ncbi:MAG: iron response transcriptional regulator IrrA [Magnetovibrionaceae bacterium]
MEQVRPYAEVLEKLRSVGLRPTRQRMALAKLLFTGTDRHVTAEILHAEAVENNVRVSLATVYNTLHQFTTAGLLREIAVDATRSSFDTNTTEHHHFYFEDTGELVDIPGDQMPLPNLPAPPTGGTVSRVDVVVRLNSAEHKSVA